MASNWFEGEARLSALAPLRDDILARRLSRALSGLAAGRRGQRRARSAHDEELEPPVPPGLKELSAPLAEFVRFFQLDPFLVQAAAQASDPLRPAPAPALDALIARLPHAECDAFLRRLAEGEPLLALKFNRRLQELAGPPARPRQPRLGARGPNCARPLSRCARRRNVANKPRLRPSGSETCRILRPAPRRPGAMCKIDRGKKRGPMMSGRRTAACYSQTVLGIEKRLHESLKRDRRPHGSRGNADLTATQIGRP